MLTKFKFTGCSKEQKRFGGNTGDPSELVIGHVYEITDIFEHSRHTEYRLKGHEGSFNSVCFEEVD
jgi:hypothetical protein